MRKINIPIIIGLFTLIVTIPLLLLLKLIPSDEHYKTVKISGAVVKAEVADTYLKRMEGLMSRTTLPRDQGMLFVFDYESKHGIWMMNTSIPLDIIWIDSNHKIVDILKNAQPCFLICEIYRPDKPARYVLEVNAGFSKKTQLQIGDTISIS